MSVAIQAAAIDVAEEYARLVESAPGAAVATFTGYVRDFSEETAVHALELEHYPEMAQVVLQALGDSAAERFGLAGWRVVHRYGVLSVAETIVWVGTVAAHRGDALSACEYMMDTLKTDAPFWKREHGPSGNSWVQRRGSDDERRARWSAEEGA